MAVDDLLRERQGAAQVLAHSLVLFINVRSNDTQTNKMGETVMNEQRKRTDEQSGCNTP
jgi:hypothetical protein